MMDEFGGKRRRSQSKGSKEKGMSNMMMAVIAVCIIVCLIVIYKIFFAGEDAATAATPTAATAATAATSYVLKLKMSTDAAHKYASSVGELFVINGDTDVLIHKFPENTFTDAKRLAGTAVTHTISGMESLPSKLKLKMLSLDGIDLMSVKINDTSYGTGLIQPDNTSESAEGDTITINKQ